MSHATCSQSLHGSIHGSVLIKMNMSLSMNCFAWYQILPFAAVCRSSRHERQACLYMDPSGLNPPQA